MVCQSKEPYVEEVRPETLIELVLVAMMREGISQREPIGTEPPSVERVVFSAETR
jgi:hypothetical protein